MLSTRRPNQRGSSRAVRSGKVTLALLVALPCLLLAMSFAILAAELVQTRTEMRDATDAAALAAVQTFVDDRLLLENPQTMFQLIGDARTQAQTYAQYNLVFGQELQLQPNQNNAEDGDIVVGILSVPRDKNFTLPYLLDPNCPDLLAINTVRVTGQRNKDRSTPMMWHNAPFFGVATNDATAVSTATLDRDIIGFRPMGQQPMPFVPIALFSHPQAQRKHCWEFQVEKRGGADQWNVVRPGGRPQIASGPDGLFEMQPKLGTAKQLGQQQKKNNSDLNKMLQEGQFSCCLLQLGNGDTNGLSLQIVNGVSRDDLTAQDGQSPLNGQPALDGQIVLNANNQLMLPGTPWGPTTDTSEGTQLQNALKQLQLTAEARIWPLFSSFDKSSGMPVLSGFVAARVVQVTDASANGGGITFSVQPCMMSTATALTDATRRGIGSARLPNPYICKVRLVE